MLKQYAGVASQQLAGRPIMSATESGNGISRPIQTALNTHDKALQELAGAINTLEDVLSLFVSPAGPEETGTQPEPPAAIPLISELEGMTRRVQHLSHRVQGLTLRVG